MSSLVGNVHNRNMQGELAMMSIRRPVAAALAVLFVSTATVVSAEDAVTLRYKYGEDDKLIYRTTTTLKQMQTFNNQKFKTDVVSEDISIRTLEEVDKKGGFAIRTENKLLKTTMDIPMQGKYVFDSKSDERDKGSAIGAAVTPIYDRLNGAILTIKHTPRGKVTAVDGYKELMQGVLKNDPLGAQFAGGENGALIKFADAFPVMNAKPVQPGDTWVDEYELEMPKLGKAKGKKTYIYVGKDKLAGRATVKLTVTNELSFDLDLALNGAKTTGNLSISKSSGTIHFDAVKGQLVSMKAEFTMGGNINVAVGGQNIAIQTERVQNVVVELLDKLPE